MFWNHKSRQLVGIDLHTDEIRLLQLKKHPRGYTVLACGALPLPGGAILNGKICQLELVQARLQKLVSMTRTQGASAAMALPAGAVITRQVAVPRATLSSGLFQAYFPGVTEALCFDYSTERYSGATAEIFLIAARQATVNQYLLLASQTGLKIKIIDVENHALARLEKIAPAAFTSIHATLKLNASRFLLCAALAMRELPVW